MTVLKQDLVFKNYPTILEELFNMLSVFKKHVCDPIMLLEFSSDLLGCKV